MVEIWREVLKNTEPGRRAKDYRLPGHCADEQAMGKINLNMLSKNMDEKLISDTAELPIDRVRVIKKDNLDKIH